MLKIKIIDLLNKIANGEEVPKKIKYLSRIYEYSEEIRDYEDDDYRYENLYDKYLTARMFKNGNTEDMLNSKLEIIEEPQEHKIPEKIKIDNEDRIQALSTGNYCYKVKQIDKIIIYKINEILDYLEGIK